MKPKLSIIVPAYNEEENIENTLNSLLKTKGEYEIIVINDGSTDNTQEKIDLFTDKKIIKIKQQNKGLSETRNLGVKKSNAEYIMFVDSDDTIDHKILTQLLNEKLTNYDLVKFSYNIIQNNNITPKNTCISEGVFEGEKLLVKLIEQKEVFEMAVLYLYKKDFIFKNKFEFESNKYHEDFGLVPLVLLKANKVFNYPYNLYNYNMDTEGITRGNNIDKNNKRANDVMELGLNLLKQSKTHDFKSKYNERIFNSFVANGIINSIELISDKKTKNEYVRKLNNNNILNYLIENNLKQKLKKIYLKIKFNNRRKNENE